MTTQSYPSLFCLWPTVVTEEAWPLTSYLPLPPAVVYDLIPVSESFTGSVFHFSFIWLERAGYLGLLTPCSLSSLCLPECPLGWEWSLALSLKVSRFGVLREHPEEKSEGKSIRERMRKGMGSHGNWRRPALSTLGFLEFQRWTLRSTSSFMPLCAFVLSWSHLQPRALSLRIWALCKPFHLRTIVKFEITQIQS